MEQGAPKGKGKGEEKGGFHGKGYGPALRNPFPFPPPSGGGGKGGAPPASATATGWRKTHQASVRAAKDAAAAARLAAGADAMETVDSDAGSQCPGDYFGASRHNRRLASEVKAYNPEAASKLDAAADVLYQRGQEAMPPAQQVATLEKRVEAKCREVDAIHGKMASLQAQLQQVNKEGSLLVKQLEEAKAKLAAAPIGGPLVPPAAPAMNAQAVMSFMRAFAATLSQDAGGAFGTALDHIEQIFSSQEVPLPAPAGPPPGRAGDGAADPSADSALSLALVSPAPLGSAVPVVTPVVDVEAAAAPAAAVPASASVATGPPLGGAASGRGSQIGRSSRGRSRTHSPTVSLRTRVSGKSAAPGGENGAEAVAAAFIRDGKRYFSDFAERAGLGDDL